MSKKARRRANRVKRWRRRLYLRQGGLCAYCGRRLLWHRFDGNAAGPPPAAAATLDHVVPRIAGGTHHHANFALACYSCNQAKGGGPAAGFSPPSRTPPPEAAGRSP